MKISVFRTPNDREEDSSKAKGTGRKNSPNDSEEETGQTPNDRKTPAELGTDLTGTKPFAEDSDLLDAAGVGSNLQTPSVGFP